MSPNPAAEGTDAPLILFDGVCNLCNATIQWILERETEPRFHFATLQSEAARVALSHAGGDRVEDQPDSIVFIDEHGVHARSTAALRIARHLRRPYRWLALFLWIPRFVRDPVYRFVARNRYAWFGTRDRCMRPTAELAARFLDTNEPNPGGSPPPQRPANP